MKVFKTVRGFTLVELLVVISIIALLLSILMPALGRARDMGKRVVCLSNVKTLGLAWTAYATANQDNLIGGFVGVKGTTTDPDLKIFWHSWVEIPKDEAGVYTGGTPSLLMAFRDASLEDEIRGIKDGLLYSYIGDVKPYHCSSDPRINNSETALRSYTIVAGMGVNDSEYNSTWKVDGAMKLSQIRSPSQKYVFSENRDARGWNMGFWDIVALSSKKLMWWNVVAGWHKKCSNWSFADGHSEVQIWKDSRTIDLCTELDYLTQLGMRAAASVNNEDLKWIANRRMNKW